MEQVKFKIIKKDEVNAQREKVKEDIEFIESHSLSLLSLLIRRYPDKAREFLRRTESIAA